MVILIFQTRLIYRNSARGCQKDIVADCINYDEDVPTTDDVLEELLDTRIPSFLSERSPHRSETRRSVPRTMKHQDIHLGGFRRDHC